MSRLISSLLKHKPGIRPRFFNQKKRAREEDAFDSSECDHAFSKAGSGGITPFEGPLRFPLDAWHGLDRAEEVLFLHGGL